jgi:uncharacterized protein (DUF2336 family)
VNPDQLLALAHSRQASDRERLLMGVVEMCEQASVNDMDLASRAAATDTLQEVFLSLVATAERDLRRRLAERLSHASWTPHGLVTVLSLDEIEIARPVIAASPVLTDKDLMRVLIEKTLEHQIEVARRPHISSDLVDTILEQNQPVVMAALAANESADIGMMQLTRMVSASRRISALRSPLVRHPKMTVDLAYALYAWVGDTLRRSIAGRFRVDEARLAQIVQEAVTHEHFGQSAEDAAASLQSPAPQSNLQNELDQQLITKLDAAGQLRPSYLLRTLREGKLPLFKAALAKLGGFPMDKVELATQPGQGELLALACASVGIDRSVFPTILGLVGQLNPSAGTPQSMGPEIRAAFLDLPADAGRLFLLKASQNA